MSNLDFLLSCVELENVSTRVVDGNTLVSGIYYGSEDLTWVKYEYTFDRSGNYISHKEIDRY